jgi:hypothetical protein
MVVGKYFQRLGIPLVSGRFFDVRDGRDGTSVAIVNQTLARRLFPGLVVLAGAWTEISRMQTGHKIDGVHPSSSVGDRLDA